MGLTGTFYRKNSNAILPKYAEERAAGCDLFASEGCVLLPGKVTIVHTGIVAKPPFACHWELCLRSSFPVKHPGLVLANSVGIIDESYCGPEDEIKIAILNTSDVFYTINAGDKIAQLVLRENNVVEIVEGDYSTIVKNINRGGFGSTDSK